MELTAEEKEVLTRVLRRLLGDDKASPPLSLRERRLKKAREQADGSEKKD